MYFCEILQTLQSVSKASEPVGQSVDVKQPQQRVTELYFEISLKYKDKTDSNYKQR